MTSYLYPGRDVKIKFKDLKEMIRRNLQEKALTTKERNKMPGSSFAVSSSSSKDKKDHFPVNDKSHARNALSRVGQYDSNPPWHKGSLSSLKKKVKSKVKAKFPDIRVSDKD